MPAVSATELLSQLEEARREGRVGAIVLGNVDDRLVDSQGGPSLSISYSILRHFADQGFHTALASASGGLEPIVAPGQRPGSSPIPAVPPATHPEAILREITPLLHDGGQPVAMVIRHPGHFVSGTGGPVCAEILYEWSIDERCRRAGSFVVLLDPQDHIPELLREHAFGFKLLRVGYPSREERARFTARRLEELADNRERPVTEIGSGAITHLTSGLRIVEIDALLRGAAASGEPLSAERLRRERAARISERLAHGAEVKEPAAGWDQVAGLAHVKEHFREVARAAQSNAAAITGSTLLAGVPGVGKSFTASALARELGVPIVFIRNLYDQWVGASEARVERLIETLTAFEGCVCVFEEVDQLLGRRSDGPSGDGGTSERVRGRLMEFMGGTYPGIHFVGLTNRPDLLDVANRDRFGVLIPVLHPGLRERMALLPYLLEQERRGVADNVDLRAIAAHERLQLTTARSLIVLVRLAGQRADAEAGHPAAPIAQRHLEQVVARYSPKLDRLEHELLSLTAVAGCQCEAHLPWMSWEGRRKDVDLPPFLETFVDLISGEVDEEALSARLAKVRELRAWRGVR